MRMCPFDSSSCRSTSTPAVDVAFRNILRKSSVVTSAQVVLKALVMKALGFVLASVILVACADPSSDDGSSQGGNALSNQFASPDGNVPPFASTDSYMAYGAKVRVSFDGGAVSESAESSSYGGALSDRPRPWALGIAVSPAGRPVFLYFGASGAKQIAPGTMSCADGSASIFEAEWNSDGSAKPARNARDCSLVIDAVDPGPSSDYVRVLGHFEATAAAPDGLSTDLKGAFIGDFAIGR
jgi:hypothetical protein